jgi:biopolymer transport protein ExbB/TolQ
MQVIEFITAACGMVAAIATLLIVWTRGGRDD